MKLYDKKKSFSPRRDVNLAVSVVLFIGVNLNIAADLKDGFQDPLDTPAIKHSTPQEQPLIGLTKAGDRLVAVGLRGLIIYSDDGTEWAQAEVAVQSDLLAVHFPSATHGWAVGHDGVILHSSDAGVTWMKQTDGREAEQMHREYYRTRAKAGEEAAIDALSLIDLNYRSGPSLPYLDVWFEDTLTGFAVGSFGNIAATVDGGKTWLPWFDRIENSEALHLNSIRMIAGETYIAAERGYIFKLDRAAQRFVPIETGYAGSFFGITGDENALLAFGLRGTVYTSSDAGNSWRKVPTPSEATITSGSVSPDAKFVLANNSGQFLVADGQRTNFHLVSPKNYMRFTSLVLSDDGSIVTTGLSGIMSHKLSSLDHAQVQIRN